MRTLLRSFALFAFMVALVGFGGLSANSAFQKDKDKEKKDEVGTIEVYKGKDGWRFRVKNPEGKSVAIGTVAHEKKEDCLKDIDIVKTTFEKAKVTEVKEPKKDKDKKD